MLKLPARIYRFYRDGFRGMPGWGKSLWLIIMVKIFIIFGILKIFFFPDFLKKDFSTDRERSDYVMEQITNEK